MILPPVWRKAKKVTLMYRVVGYRDRHTWVSGGTFIELGYSTT